MYLTEYFVLASPNNTNKQVSTVTVYIHSRLGRSLKASCCWLCSKNVLLRSKFNLTGSCLICDWVNTFLSNQQFI